MSEIFRRNCSDRAGEALNLARLRSRENWASREENPVTFAANLSKVDNRGCRVGHESETVSGAQRCSRGDGDSYVGDLEKVSSKMVHWIAEAGKALDHVAPLNIQ